MDTYSRFFFLKIIHIRKVTPDADVVKTHIRPASKSLYIPIDHSAIVFEHLGGEGNWRHLSVSSRKRREAFKNPPFSVFSSLSSLLQKKKRKRQEREKKDGRMSGGAELDQLNSLKHQLVFLFNDQEHNNKIPTHPKT